MHASTPKGTVVVNSRGRCIQIEDGDEKATFDTNSKVIILGIARAGYRTSLPGLLTLLQ